MKPKTKHIHVEDNNFQHLEVLKSNRKKRHSYNKFYVEGVRLIESLILHKWQIYGFYYSSKRKLSDWAQNVLSTAPAENHFIVAPHLMEKLSEKEETSELIAVAYMPPDDFSRIKDHENMLVVLFDRPNSPGNLGSSIRSCDAFGVDGIIVTGHSADIYHPHAVRGSMGSLFAQNTIRVQNKNTLLRWIESMKEKYTTMQIIGSSAQADIEAKDIDTSKPTLLIAGNETSGMSSSYKELCDTIVTIPQRGWVSSLNVSCALSILLYEATKGRE